MFTVKIQFPSTPKHNHYASTVAVAEGITVLVSTFKGIQEVRVVSCTEGLTSQVTRPIYATIDSEAYEERVKALEKYVTRVNARKEIEGKIQARIDAINAARKFEAFADDPTVAALLASLNSLEK